LRVKKRLLLISWLLVAVAQVVVLAIELQAAVVLADLGN